MFLSHPFSIEWIVRIKSSSLFIFNWADSNSFLLFNTLFSTYSNKNVIAFVENKLENKNELDSSKFKITNDQELILTIHSMLKGWDKNIFYKIELQEGNVPTSGYNIPKMTYLRRRKL